MLSVPSDLVISRANLVSSRMISWEDREVYRDVPEDSNGDAVVMFLMKVSTFSFDSSVLLILLLFNHSLCPSSRKQRGDHPA